MQSSNCVQALPLEVVEDILVFLAIAGEFTSISSFAQACRRLRQFVYDPTDNHLWHRIFLTTFDDPCIGLGEAQGAQRPFDWGEETRKRIQASLLLRPGHKGPEPGLRAPVHRLRSAEWEHPSEGDPLTDYSVPLRIVLSVFNNLAPLPRSSAPSSEDLIGQEGSFVREMSLVEADARSPLAPPTVQGLWSSHLSRSILWLYSILNRGLPLILPCRFAHSRIDKAWLHSEESLALHKIIALCGIQFLLNAHPDGPANEYNWRWKFKDRFQWPRLGEQGRRDLIKRLCQARVFQMDYPSVRRCWGPFLQAETYPQTAGSAKLPPVTPFSSYSTEDDEYQPSIGRRSLEPPADKIYPDWVHLSAVRVVVESCLRSDDVFRDILAPLTDWSALRPGFWVPSNVDRSQQPLGNLSSLYERDWAGVEGVWQRCVVWLDYDNLVTQNYVDFGSNIEPIDEVVLIVPLTMKITGYSPSVIPGYEHLPDIRFEGEMGGALWDLEQDIRRIHGTVSVIADGSIRWSTYSSPAGDPEDDEWASEGVQLGGIGSRCGILGLWTGASHDQQGEPIGAWWQWRVV
ncbi:hypothetical protein BDY19DRAFT_916086 [Irpex rosettiformis]|uniref:Uncharacterized protein n=1 Tax=Irpex rosettiformis TaxID=378272 RepID=A0ACB8ULB6_9APHY|nr:hypothetical protein BDY19DRAFT_916086 [Irpex rosettiformis]